MKVYLHTWRYGIETEFEYHGRNWGFDPANRILEIFDPIHKDGFIGKRQVVTITDGEQFFVRSCEATCEFNGHASGTDGERLTRRPDGAQIISFPGA